MPTDDQDQRDLEAERELSARMHKYFGWLSTVLVLVAVVVALSRMRAMFGVSPWEALGIGSTGLPWVLLILGLGVVFSMGTTRLMLFLEWVVKRIKGNRAGR